MHRPPRPNNLIISAGSSIVLFRWKLLMDIRRQSDSEAILPAKYSQGASRSPRRGSLLMMTGRWQSC